MKKVKLYPKTTRLGKEKLQLTEKLDGSNLGFFKLNGVIYVAQRNYVFKLDEISQYGDLLYGGLLDFVNENHAVLNKIVEGAIVFGEWLGMSKINYNGTLPSMYMLFAKARISETNGELSTFNYRYDVDTLKYAFDNQSVPNEFGIVPVIESEYEVNMYNIDQLYDEYVKKVGRKVEGFVLSKDGKPEKYVRFKNGKPTNHFESK